MSQDDPARDVDEALFRAACDPAPPPLFHEALAEFFHTMRNRLNGLKLGLYIGRRLEQDAGQPLDGEWDRIEFLYGRLEQDFNQVQTVLGPLRLQPLDLNLTLFLQEKARNWRNRLATADQGFTLLVPDTPTTARFDAMMLGQALDQLAAWRFRWGREPRLLMGVEDGHVTLIWDEIGTPVAKFNPASQGRGTIALALLAKVVTAHSGEIGVNRTGSFRVRMKWPLHPVFPKTSESLCPQTATTAITPTRIAPPPVRVQA